MPSAPSGHLIDYLLNRIEITVTSLQIKTFRNGSLLLALTIFLSLLSGCSTLPKGYLPSAGPNASDVVDEAPVSPRLNGIQVVDVNDGIARKLLEGRKQKLFSETLAKAAVSGFVVGAGDALEVTIWEAPPATLFGSSSTDSHSGPATSKANTFPEQMVGSEGSIMIPFAGQIPVVGKTLQQIERTIEKRLTGLANQPQVMIRLQRNATRNVTVVGEVGNSARVPLTPRGERLLDALAAAGGVKQPVSKMTLQLTRGNSVNSLPLDTIIRDPKQNILLQPGDVITAIYQPLSFTLLGATGKNEEINFEAQGISLAQALARGGGLLDARADATGVFIFRFEEQKALDWPTKPVVTTPEGKVPVVYRVDMKDPATFFVAQSFPIRNSDVLYVANASSVELQKFLNIIMSMVYPIINVIPLARTL
jgi:polysaccharide export outer membrane protein